MTDRAAAELDALREALTVALRTSQRRTPPGEAPPPTSLTPFASFRKFPLTALGAARQALEADDPYRERVAGIVGDDETVVGRAGALFLHQPEGWEDEFDALISEQLASDAEMEDRSARRELERSTELVADLTERLSSAADRERDLRTALDNTRDELATANSRAAEAAQQIEELTEARTAAVRQLKAVEAQLSARHEELAELRAARTEDHTTPNTDAADAPDPEVLRRAREVLAAARNDISDELAATAARLQATIGAVDAALADGSSTAFPAGETSERPVPTRDRSAPRRPLRIGRGIPEDSADAARLLMAEPAMDVLIDGYNVVFSAWPTMSPGEGRDLLVQRLEQLDANIAARVTVVFDGISRSRGAGRGLGSRVRVRFTDEGVEADDEILALVGAVPHERGVTVVSDDRRVIEGARERGANVVRSVRLIELFRN